VIGAGFFVGDDDLRQGVVALHADAVVGQFDVVED